VSSFALYYLLFAACHNNLLERARRAIRGFLQLALVEADVKVPASEWQKREVSTVSESETI
jgi:hypothetical protein